MASKIGRYTKVSYVVPGSICDEIGVKPGDVLLQINGNPIMDVFEYRILEKEEYLTLTFFLDDDQCEQTVEIEKEEDELLGLEFEDPMMCSAYSCHNKCIFCFIDQLPKGMRPTLYFKDDDMRMSFLTGNYVTLTNMSDEEFERLLSYHLSPMNISVHATDPEVRKMMLHNRFAGRLLERMHRIAEEGIEMNCQFVLCPGINDGEILEKSLRDLEQFGEAIKSIACVPVGLTKFRDENGLFKVQRYNVETAGAVCDIVDKWQKHFLETRGTRLFYAGDEFYIRAERPMPPAEDYEGYPQLENGVGLVANYVEESDQLLTQYEEEYGKRPRRDINVWEILGTDSLPFHQANDDRMSDVFGINFKSISVLNDFFGHTITVTGLLTGGDIISQINERIKQEGKPDMIMISHCMLKADEDIFLDDITLDEVIERTGVDFHVAQGGSNAMKILADRYLRGEENE